MTLGCIASWGRSGFLDEARVRRHLSIDFTIPEAIAPSLLAGDTVYIPIEVLAKRVLRALDVVDGEGRAVPVLTSDENGMVAGRVLVECATRFSRPTTRRISSSRSRAVS
jgi:hypothetical protein